MYLQGQLQVVFDVLYEMGVIEPMLKMNWQDITKEVSKNPEKKLALLSLVNSCDCDKTVLHSRLVSLDDRSLQLVAMEVARELCEYQECRFIH